MLKVFLEKSSNKLQRCAKVDSPIFNYTWILYYNYEKVYRDIKAIPLISILEA